jgi:thiol-disulfide isomerase/thioredoxin
MSKTQNAFAIIHFGSNPKYFELELYFCSMLKDYTENNIIYMYSTSDTPASFVTTIEPFVYKTIGFDDNKITNNVEFTSGYASFNTLRTCDFIFAYTLMEYEKICIIESDLVIMGNIDSIFRLNTPSILYYGGGETNLNKNTEYHSNENNVLRECREKSDANGGVMVIRPSMELFHKCVETIPIIAENQCKYPNEALFQYVNKTFYNLPVKYNLSHYHTLRLNRYGMNPDGSEVLIFHFNETDKKHLDIIKDKWLEENKDNAEVMTKYRVRKIPIFHFRDTVYKNNKDKINDILDLLSSSASASASAATENEWEEVMSKSKGKPYWVNKITKETTWTNPNNSKPAVVSEWEEVMSKSKGKPYWVNKITKETTWTNPNDSKLAIVSEWEEVMSKSKGKPYWINKITKETTWTNPNDSKGGKKTKKNKRNKRCITKNKKRMNSRKRR